MKRITIALILAVVVFGGTCSALFRGDKDDIRR